MCYSKLLLVLNVVSHSTQIVVSDLIIKLLYETFAPFQTGLRKLTKQVAELNKNCKELKNFAHWPIFFYSKL